MAGWAHTDCQTVARLIAEGYSERQVADLTGVPRSTINYWRRKGVHHSRRALATPSWRPADPGAYCYALGIYLGDGHLHVRSEFAATLVVTLDSRYGGVVEEVAGALGRVIQDASVRRYFRKGGSVAALQMSHPVLPHAFPQHGPGRKHTRAIELVDWQRELTCRHPRELIRGLIHSDGCRTVNRFSVRLPSGRLGEYAYGRYFFSNLSEDIRRIFCEHCDLLGIRWTQSNPRNISISHRTSVALLDTFVGPKT